MGVRARSCQPGIPSLARCHAPLPCAVVISPRVLGRQGGCMSSLSVILPRAPDQAAAAAAAAAAAQNTVCTLHCTTLMFVPVVLYQEGTSRGGGLAAARQQTTSICGSPAYHRTELLRRRDQRTVATTTGEWLARGDEEDRHRTLDPTRVKASDGVERGPSSYCPRIPSPDPSCASRPNARPRCHPTWPAAI